MAFASISTTLASPFEQMQRQAMEGLYGMGLTGEMSIGEIRRRQQQMQRFGKQAKNIFENSLLSPQTESMSFSDSMRFGSGSANMPYSSTIMGGGRSLPYSGYNSMQPYSSWSSMGQAPRFPYSGMMY